MSELPLGWNYNPAAWSQRLPLLALAFIGFALSGWFALFSFNSYVSLPFVSFFPRFHLFSASLRRWFAAPELAISAIGFLLLLLGNLVGGTRRWRTHPHLVLALGFMLLLLAGFNVSQTALQLVYAHSWCLPLVLISLFSLLMIGPAMDEVLASLQHLKRTSQLRRRPWRLFFERRSVFHMDS